MCSLSNTKEVISMYSGALCFFVLAVTFSISAQTWGYTPALCEEVNFFTGKDDSCDIVLLTAIQGTQIVSTTIKCFVSCFPLSLFLSRLAL